jgi:hypothetical protein
VISGKRDENIFCLSRIFLSGPGRNAAVAIFLLAKKVCQARFQLSGAGGKGPSAIDLLAALEKSSSIDIASGNTFFDWGNFCPAFLVLAPSG